MSTTVVKTYDITPFTIDLSAFCDCGAPCDTCCGQVTGCCPGVSIPTTLHANWTVHNNAPPTPCGCAVSGTIVLTWNATDSAWEGSGPLGSCAGTITYKFYCFFDGATYVWKLDTTLDCATGSSGQLVSTLQCDPLSANFNAQIGITACCNVGASGNTLTTVVTL